MNNIKIATAQFEHRSNDKEHNLGVIESLATKPASQGAEVVAFHECSVTGYTFARHLSEVDMIGVAESIPDGPSIERLIRIAAKNNVHLLAGLFEKDRSNNLFKAFDCSISY